MGELQLLLLGLRGGNPRFVAGSTAATAVEQLSVGGSWEHKIKGVETQ